MTRTGSLSLALGFVAIGSLAGSAGLARAGETVVPEDDLVRAAARLEASTVRLRVTARDGAGLWYSRDGGGSWNSGGVAYLGGSPQPGAGDSAAAARAALERATEDVRAAEERLAAERAALAERAAAEAKARDAAKAKGDTAPDAVPIPALRVESKAGGRLTVDGRLARIVFGRGDTTREGRGVFVGDGHAILTAASVVEGAVRVEIVLSTGSVEGVVSGVDRDFGVAVVRSSASGPAIEVDASSELEPGRIVLVAGAAADGGMDVRAVSSRETMPGGRGLARLATPLPATAVGAPALGPDGRLRAIVGSSARAIPTDAMHASATDCATCHKLGPDGWSVTDATGRLLMRYGPVAPVNGVTVDEYRTHPWRILNGLDGASSGAAWWVPALVPARRIARALPELLANGKVKKGYLGVVLGSSSDPKQPLDDRRVGQVLAGSPAEGKLKAGDRIVSIGGRTLAPHDDVTLEILSLSPGQATTVQVERTGEDGRTSVVNVEVVPTERREDATARGPRAFGFEAITLTPELRAWTSIDGDGVVVTVVARGGAAERSGFRRGDVLVKIAGREVHSTADVDVAVDDGLRKLAAGETILVEFERAGKPMQAVLFDRRETAPTPAGGGSGGAGGDATRPPPPVSPPPQDAKPPK